MCLCCDEMYAETMEAFGGLPAFLDTTRGFSAMIDSILGSLRDVCASKPRPAAPEKARLVVKKRTAEEEEETPLLSVEGSGVNSPLLGVPLPQPHKNKRLIALYNMPSAGLCPSPPDGGKVECAPAEAAPRRSASLYDIPAAAIFVPPGVGKAPVVIPPTDAS